MTLLDAIRTPFRNRTKAQTADAPFLGYYLPPENGARAQAIKAGQSVSYNLAGGYVEGSLQPDPNGYAYAYTVSTWAYRCVRVRRKAVGRMPWKVVDKKTKQAIPDHPLALALNLNKQKLFGKIEFTQVLFGETFIEKYNNPHGYPYGLNWLNNLGMDVDTTTGQIGGYDYSPVQGGRYTHFKPEQVAFMHTEENPFDDLRGLSPFLVILDELGIDRDVARVVRAFFANDARVGKWLIPKTPMNEPDQERFMAWFKANYQGVKNAGKPALLSHPVDVVDAQNRPTLDDVQLRESTRREICAALGVPMSIAGAWDDATYQSAPEQRKSLYEETIIPECDDIADFINSDVLPFFDPAGTALFMYDYSEILALIEDTNDKVTKLNNKLLSGGITLNRYREQIGEKPLPNGEVLYIPNGVTVTPLAKIGQMPAPQGSPFAIGGGASGGLFQSNPPLVQNPPIAHALGAGSEPPKVIPVRAQKTEAPDVTEACYAVLSLANNASIKALQDDLRADYPYVEWSDPKTFHITLVYASQATDLQTIQDIVPKSVSPLTFDIGPVATFPSHDGKQPVILNVTAPGPLVALQNQLYSAFHALGLTLSEYSEPAAWQPHVTLGYMPADKPLPNWQEMLTVTSGKLEITIEQGDSFKQIAVAPTKAIDVTPKQDDPLDELAAWEKKALNTNPIKAAAFVCYRLPESIQRQVLVGLTALPRDAERAAVKAVFARARAAFAAEADKEFDPNQPRDESGEWSGTGGGGGGSGGDKKIISGFSEERSGKIHQAMDRVAAGEFSKRDVKRMFSDTEKDINYRHQHIALLKKKAGLGGMPVNSAQEAHDFIDKHSGSAFFHHQVEIARDLEAQYGKIDHLDEVYRSYQYLLDNAKFGKRKPDTTKAELDLFDQPPSAYQSYWQHYDDLQQELGTSWIADYMRRAYEALAGQINGDLPDHVIDEALGNYREDLAAEWVGTADDPGPLTRLVLGGMAAATESVGSGADMNPVKAGVALSVDWKLLSRQALDFTRQYMYDLIRGLDETTREQVRQAITAWLESGQPLDELKKSIEAIFRDPVRAERIASSESSRAYNQGAQERWRSLDIQKMAWETNNDDLVCQKICAPMQGLIGEVGKGWIHPTLGLINLPGHTGCRCFARPRLD